jgi:cell division transport system ATP-binding protein
VEKWGKGMTGIKTFGNNETAETIIRMQNVNLVYPTGTAALKDCSLEIGKGEFVFIVGSSGSGKSTLIKTLLGELEISSGRIEVAGKDLANMTRKELPYFRRKLGVVFQEFRLLDEMNVFENVALAQRVVGVSSRERRRKNSLAMLEMVGLSKKLKAYPNELSGGEQQRVAIARAMVNRPAILLADEPTGNLDPENSWEIMKLLQDVHELGTTVLVVSHNEDIVNKMQKRVITLHKGQITSDARQGGYLQ